MVRPLEGGNTPVIVESWYKTNPSNKNTHAGVALPLANQAVHP